MRERDVDIVIPEIRAYKSLSCSRELVTYRRLFKVPAVNKRLGFL